MTPLTKDLQTTKQNLDEFADVTKRVLAYLPNVVSERVETRDYAILSSTVAGTVKFARPINTNLFINDIQEFEDRFKLFLNALRQIKNREKTKGEDYFIIDIPSNNPLGWAWIFSAIPTAPGSMSAINLKN